MRAMPLVMLLLPLLAGCAGYHSSPGAGEQSAAYPAPGTDASRDGFYDGGIYDPDQFPRAMRLPE
jgi:hypothetical protein